MREIRRPVWLIIAGVLTLALAGLAIWRLWPAG